jgi:hypothetical protein
MSSILVNIVIADEDDIEAIGDSLSPVEEWSGIQSRDLDTAKIATLHCLLTGDTFEDALSRYEPVYVVSEESAIVLRIPDAVVERMAGLDEEALAEVAVELAATEEFESTGWDDEEIYGLVEELADLAVQADANGEAMFVWMHKLRT